MAWAQPAVDIAEQSFETVLFGSSSRVIENALHRIKRDYFRVGIFFTSQHCIDERSPTLSLTPPHIIIFRPSFNFKSFSTQEIEIFNM